MNSTGACVFSAAAVYGMFLLVRLAVLGFDPSAFVVAGDRVCDPARVPASLTVREDAGCYDGLMNYRLAVDPFSMRSHPYGIVVGSYRHQRVFYPFLAWAASMGDVDLVPTTLILVNYAGLLLMAYLGGRLACLLGLHALWGLVFPFYPGFVLSLARDLTEIVAACMILGALLCIRRERHIRAAVFLTLAILTRETTLAIAGIVLATIFLQGVSTKAKRPWFIYLVPLIVAGAWNLLLRWGWGDFPFQMGTAGIGWPLVSLAEFVWKAVTFQLASVPLSLLYLIELAFLLIFTLAVLVALRESDARAHEKLAWAFYALLAVTVSEGVWSEDWAFLRVFYEFYLFGAVILLAAPHRLRVPAFASGACVCLLMLITRMKWL